LGRTTIAAAQAAARADLMKSLNGGEMNSTIVGAAPDGASDAVRSFAKDYPQICTHPCHLGGFMSAPRPAAEQSSCRPKHTPVAQ